MSKKKNLPEYRAQYLTDYFIDYAGNHRMFTLCAVTVPETTIISSNTAEHYIIHQDEIIINFDDIKNLTFPKKLKLGMAVQCPEDDANEELGKKIAYGKALKYNDHIMMVTREGMINTKLVTALLEQEAEYFKKNPDSYIAGYKKKMWKYKVEQMEDVIKNKINKLHAYTKISD